MLPAGLETFISWIGRSEIMSDDLTEFRVDAGIFEAEDQPAGLPLGSVTFAERTVVPFGAASAVLHGALRSARFGPA